MMLYQWLRPALFRLSGNDPERAHEWVMHLLAAASCSPVSALAGLADAPLRDPRLDQRLFGLSFPNPVGLAAGFDKNAVALPALAALGFGFVEAGTVTYHPQHGNPRPRVQRLAEYRALINRMGFNNDGAAAIARRLARLPRLPVPLGVSLGKSRITPIEDAVEDYRASFRLLAPHAGYIAVNVSSPNTPGLRALQERELIDALLAALGEEADALAARSGRPVPLLVKVAPDLGDDALDDLLEVCEARAVAGVIAVNTTLARPIPARDDFEGGLSGPPLFPRALAVVRHIRRRTDGRLPVIGVGGISSARDAYAMLRAGASLLQLYTAFIYEGPLVARRINHGLLRLMARDGLKTIVDAVGAECGGGRHSLSTQQREG